MPVAAPGIRAAGLAEGLRAHGHDVNVAIPQDVLAQLFGDDIPPPPNGALVAAPTSLQQVIVDGEFTVVVFINANLAPHLRPIPGVHYVYDLFAPKLLESLASPSPARPWQDLSAEKSRAMALADSVWVNGRRKLGYGLSWLLRPDVDAIRTTEFGLPSIVNAHVADRLSVVEMPVPLPADLTTPPAAHGGERIRLGVAGYSQEWSALTQIHRGHQLFVDAGHELHALLPAHWGGGDAPAPRNALPKETTIHSGPLIFEDFARWVRGMDAMVDVFAATSERRFAMITRSAVALRLGVPLVHAVDSEIADIVEEHDAGWTLDPGDNDGWQRVSNELTDPGILEQKRRGAAAASRERFAPTAALASAAQALSQMASR